MSASHKKMTMGIIVGNRGFFPDHLAKSGREEILRVLEAANIDVVALTPEESKHGAVETREESRRCADLFKRNRERIDGIIVTLPNFGEERAIADALRLADLRVPVLIQATPDDPAKMAIAFRRDSFCGKMSACNNLRQYGIPYSITTLHTESLDSPEFAKDLEWFAAVCRVVNGFRNLRVGAIGARPAAFNTVRYSEKILESQGISIETLDLSEVLGRISRMKDNDDHAQAKLAAIKKYADSSDVPAAALLKMAKLGAVVDQWMAATEVAISAVQCWTSIEENLGVVPCTIMSMMSNELLSSACEVDICGVLGMHALQLASGTPSALLDWNNNYGADPNKAVCFHCSNLPKHFFRSVKMDFQAIIAGTVGKENTFGTCVGVIRPEKMSFARFSTDDTSGKMRGYVGAGQFTDDPLNTFGGAGVVEIPKLQRLLHFICEKGFEHHVAANLSSVASAVHEATTRYFGWDMYWHGHDNGACGWRSSREWILGRLACASLWWTANAVSWSPRLPNTHCIASAKIRNTPPNPMTITCGRWLRRRAKP
jgi:L-fucose isomerase-like protein